MLRRPGVKRRFWTTAVICTAIVAGAGTASAQVVLPGGGSAAINKNVFGLGLFGGPATGIGLSFRHHLPSPLSYQLTGGIINVDERLSYAVGAELQYDLSRSPASRFYIAGGFGYYYSGPTGSANRMDAPARAAFGVGGEFIAGAGIHSMLDLLFTYFSDGTVLPLPQLGLYYYF